MTSRRHFLKQLATLNAALCLSPAGLLASAQPRLRRRIPASGELIPVIGMGSWLTFDVGHHPEALDSRVEVLREFFKHEGGMIDSSPMYGTSEAVIGQCLQQLGMPKTCFSATKVWTPGKDAGIRQMQHSEELWGIESFDLMQIHNMLDWRSHYETLKQWKQQGRIRYIGITTSHGRRHDALEQALSSNVFDFVQLTYNVIDRDAEKRLLPLAQERGVAVIVNRPFRGGDLFTLYGSKPLPGWAKEIDCTNWAQFFLKFIVSHPAVTCAIPATSQPEHMQENMGAGVGALPDAAMRQRMLDYIHSL